MALYRWDDGILVGADSAEEESQNRCDCQRNDGDGDDGDRGPEEEGMPLP